MYPRLVEGSELPEPPEDNEMLVVLAISLMAVLGFIVCVWMFNK